MKRLVTFLKSARSFGRNNKKTLVTSSCLVSVAVAATCTGYYYYIQQPNLLAAETAISLNNEISDETERRRKCSQLVKQFKVRYPQSTKEIELR